MAFSSGNISLTGQTASIGTTNLIASPEAGLYLGFYALYTETAGSAGTVLLTFAWNDGNTKTVSTGTVNMTLVTFAAGVASGNQIIRLAAGTPLTYATTVVGNIGAQYGLKIFAEKIF